MNRGRERAFWCIVLPPFAVLRGMLAGLAPVLITVPIGAQMPKEIPAPPDNPLTEGAMALGKRLFFDPVLSVDRSVACASCHQPEHGFSSPERFPAGVLGRRALRHAPTLYNRGFGERQRWDGKAASLEEQVLLPIEDANEMDLQIPAAIERLAADASYRAEFARVYAAGPDRVTLSRALASFVRGLVLDDSPADRFLAGDRAALSKDELAGMWIYESKGRCWQCHPRPIFTDEKFHNTGIGVRGQKPESEPGREAVTGDAHDRGRFKTPTLRGLANTAPYMHDGSLATLEDVVEFYRRGGNRNPDLSPKIAPLDLTDEDAEHLVAFLRAN